MSSLQKGPSPLLHLRLVLLYPLLFTLISYVQSLSCVGIFATPRTAAHQASLSITNSWSLLKLMSIESVDATQLAHPLSSPSPPTFNLSQYQGLFKLVNSLHQVAKVWSLRFSLSPSNEHPGLISFRRNWLDLLAVQEILKSLFQHHSSKASVFQYSASFIVQLSHPYMTTGKNP